MYLMTDYRGNNRLNCHTSTVHYPSNVWAVCSVKYTSFSTGEIGNMVDPRYHIAMQSC